MSVTKVHYIWDGNLIGECDRLPPVKNRASIVHELIAGYDLLSHVQVVRSRPASYEQLLKFHSELYLNHLKTIESIDEDYICNSEDEEYGLGYDCHPVSNMYELVSTIAGGSITAARCLTLGLTEVAVNWCGGWHHANRFAAEGFCYVNDIVIAIEHLRKKFPKVLYIDLDIHHGNGVQDAYNLSKSVFTLSFHKYEPGFYPGTGNIEDIGSLTGTGYACNFPLNASYSDDTIQYAFEKVFTLVYSRFEPDALVIQCGADALALDPHGGAALTTHGYGACIKTMLERHKPTLLLGGGGYNFSNTARLWASLTAQLIGLKLDDDIPEHGHWTKYGPDFKLEIKPTLSKDENKRSYLDDCISVIRGNLEKYLELMSDKEVTELKSGSGTITLGDRKTIVKKRSQNSQIFKSEILSNKMAKTSNQPIEDKTHIGDVYDFVD